MYPISKEQYKLAKKMGIHIFPSDNPKYKIDVYDSDGVYHTSIGASAYMDYFLYLASKGKDYALERRRLYAIRHKKDLFRIGSRGWFSGRLLWNI
jgi:hypothetical protein